MSSDQDEVIGEFEVERRGFIRGSLSYYKGDLGMDLRLWVEPKSNPGGELIATPAGFRIPPEYVDDLVEVAHALAATVHAREASSRRTRNVPKNAA